MISLRSLLSSSRLPVKFALTNRLNTSKRHTSGLVSALDSRIIKSLFGTSEIREVFSDDAYLKSCVQAEIALAQAQSRCGVIPREAGDAINRQLQDVAIDMEKLRSETQVVGYPILPLVRQLSAKCDDEARKYIHFGATTQDIMDSASSLQMKRGLDIIESTMKSMIRALARLSGRYMHTPMAGRTHLQHALPITFGYKCAIWLSPFQRHLERLNQLRQRSLMVQFGGAVGSLASLGSQDQGLRVRKEMASLLGLSDPLVSWHVSRDSVAETINFLALVGGSLGKLALDLILMSSNEIGEVSEPFVPHRGASSTMPQKRNPISSEVILASSKILRANAGLVLDGMIADFERASGPWHLEWCAIPESFIIAQGALHQADFVLSGLVVHTDQMLQNLHSTRGLIVAEAVMMGLAPFIGRQLGHDSVYEACQKSIEEKKSLLEVLLKNESVTSTVKEEKLRELCDPVNYMGSCASMVNHVLSKVQEE